MMKVTKQKPIDYCERCGRPIAYRDEIGKITYMWAQHGPGRCEQKMGRLKEVTS